MEATYKNWDLDALEDLGLTVGAVLGEEFQMTVNFADRTIRLPGCGGYLEPRQAYEVDTGDMHALVGVVDGRGRRSFYAFDRVRDAVHVLWRSTRPADPEVARWRDVAARLSAGEHVNGGMP